MSEPVIKIFGDRILKAVKQAKDFCEFRKILEIENLVPDQCSIIETMLEKDCKKRPIKIKEMLIEKRVEVKAIKQDDKEVKIKLENEKLEKARKEKEEVEKRLKELTKQRETAKQTSFGAVVAGKIKPSVGFTFIKEEKYTCGNISNKMQEFRHDKTGMEFVYIPGGTFDMAPNYKVTLSPYLIGKYQVTQSEWQKIMGDNPSSFKGDRRPVECVSWDDCQEFCQKTGLSLPSEAQWEHACRAGSKGRYCFGDDELKLGEYAWYDSNSGSQTHPVGEKKPSAYGLYDMHGNVWEWCQDYYGNYPSGSFTDPTGVSSGSSRVNRGGGWYGYTSNCGSANRDGSDADYLSSCLGFRCFLRLT